MGRRTGAIAPQVWTQTLVPQRFCVTVTSAPLRAPAAAIGPVHCTPVQQYVSYGAEARPACARQAAVATVGAGTPGVLWEPFRQNQ